MEVDAGAASNAAVSPARLAELRRLTAPELANQLQVFPRPPLLELRRDLALGPFEDALSRFATFATASSSSTSPPTEMTGPEPVAAAAGSGQSQQTISDVVAMRAAGSITPEMLRQGLQALHALGDVKTCKALCRRLEEQCWTYQRESRVIDRAREAFGKLSDLERKGLLDELRSGETAVRKVLARAAFEGMVLQRLGRLRLMWLLGAEADVALPQAAADIDDETGTVLSQASTAWRPKNNPPKWIRQTKRKQLEREAAEADGEESSEEDSSEAREAVKGKKRKVGKATRDWLANFRAKRAAKMDVAEPASSK
eukprot:TRINITY_DN7513_c0_g1_i1.p1 TRINITY_DN7513_c0_g1~~TRINITY_DN7513_c0_g1_i1.p1  ORF type:complete len:313 (+),score=87.08 TRINITY_DN7513_c0_g1_i1:130-1068(+)